MEFTKPIKRDLGNIGPPRCPTCGSRQGEDDAPQNWSVLLDDKGITFRKKHSKRDIYFVEWRDALNLAIKKGPVT